MNKLVPSRFLFEWSFPIKKLTRASMKPSIVLDLPADYRLPALAELDGARSFADVRMGWNESGIGVSIEVKERSRPLRASTSNPADSDGLHIWLNTRNSQRIHRATKYCQQFSILPCGGGSKGKEPVVAVVPLARSRESATPVDPSSILVRSEIRKDGYQLEVWLPAEVIAGFDPSQHSKIGFHYVVRDSELGDQSLVVDQEFPRESDPSLWPTIELVER